MKYTWLKNSMKYTQGAQVRSLEVLSRGNVKTEHFLDTITQEDSASCP